MIFTLRQLYRSTLNFMWDWNSWKGTRICSILYENQNSNSIHLCHQAFVAVVIFCWQYNLVSERCVNFEGSVQTIWVVCQCVITKLQEKFAHPVCSLVPCCCRVLSVRRVLMSTPRSDANEVWCLSGLQIYVCQHEPIERANMCRSITRLGWAEYKTKKTFMFPRRIDTSRCLPDNCDINFYIQKFHINDDCCSIRVSQFHLPERCVETNLSFHCADHKWIMNSKFNLLKPVDHTNIQHCTFFITINFWKLPRK